MEFVRYDPTREEHRVFEINNLNLDVQMEKNGKPSKTAEIEKTKSENALKPPPSQEKPTFKVASNLKNLFTETGFSLLGTFGQSAEPKNSEKDCAGAENGDSKTRSFWNKNPFKYDSSDEDDDNANTESKSHTKKNKLKATPESKSKLTPAEKPRNYFKEDLFKRDSFFFRENDERLANVFTYFLAVGADEDMEDVRKKFNDLGRAELKIIAKNKRKNSMRKNEKRVKIMRLIRRKKRREVKQKKEKLVKS